MTELTMMCINIANNKLFATFNNIWLEEDGPGGPPLSQCVMTESNMLDEVKQLAANFCPVKINCHAALLSTKVHSRSLLSMTRLYYSLILLLFLWVFGCQSQREVAGNESSLNSHGVTGNMGLEAPVLEKAILGPYEEGGLLTIHFYDGDFDVVGVGFQETRRDVNVDERMVLREEYPVLYGRRVPNISWLMGVPVQIRDNNQTKDENAWDEYIECNKDYEANWVESEDYIRGKWGWWEEQMPPVWISIPDPNKVDVYVYVVDRSGYKSKPVKLIYEDIRGEPLDLDGFDWEESILRFNEALKGGGPKRTKGGTHY
jgi:hypothetical protein